MIEPELFLQRYKNARNHKDKNGKVEENTVFLIKENAQEAREGQFFKRSSIIVHLVRSRIERSPHRIVIEFKGKKQEDKRNEVE